MSDQPILIQTLSTAARYLSDKFKFIKLICYVEKHYKQGKSSSFRPIATKQKWAVSQWYQGL